MSRSLKFKVHDTAPKAPVDDDVNISKPGAEVDALMSFAAEGGASAPVGTPGTRTRSAGGEGAALVQRPKAVHYAVACLMMLTVAAVGTALFFRMPATSGRAAAAPAPTGSVSIDSRPQGADVLISGVLRGKTPLKLSLFTGQHSMQLNFGGVTRTLPLDIQAGTIVSQYVEFATEEVVTTGRLEIGSDPSGAQVRVDGTPRGTTPLSLASIEPGEHSVVISSGDTTVTRRVTVAAGATATVVASVTAAGTAGGYVSFSAPFALQVFENGQLLGTTEVNRLMLPAGRHELELVNSPLEFRRSVAVQVAAGKTACVPVAVPDGTVSLNAQPWADVTLDGRPLGTTPLANIVVPIGSHEIVFSHPQFGERKRSVTVTASTPVRIGMDLRQ
jgi:serine/threonine-protein kinase